MKQALCIYGNAALRRKADPVPEVNEDVRQLARDLLETMYANSGVGLAAQQIGRNEAVLVIDTSPANNAEAPLEARENVDVPMPLVMINPEILMKAGEQCGDEGCLSFPEIYVKIKRAAEVTARYTDLENREQTVKATGLLSRAIQHEIDHLNAVLLVDRMSVVQRAARAGKLKRLKKQA